MKWDITCKPINIGGLGIRKAAVINQCFINKSIWKLLSAQHCLWTTWFNDNYLRGEDFWLVTTKKLDSDKVRNQVFTKLS